MFGSVQQASPFGAPASGGVLGAPASSTSLFGASASAGGTLFGASAPASGGLFGAAPSPSPGTLFGAPSSSPSLFGAKQNSTPSLFGASQPAPSPGGLFGATQPASGGLFGAKSSPAASGGLFGAPAAAPGTGLFGANTGSSLFGGNTGSSLFGPPAASGGLFGATATTSSFLSPSSAVSHLGAQSSPSLFGGGQMVAQQQQQQQQMGIEMAKNGRPITHETNFSDLPDTWQNAFKAVHAKVSEVRRDWRALQASVQVQASSQPDQEYADLTNTAKQLSTDLQAARKQLEIDCAAAERFHAELREQADATQQDEAQKQQKILQSSQLFKSMPQLPAPYFVQAVSKFRDELARLEALHQGLASLCSAKSPAGQSNSASLAALPDVLRSLHELFLHAAARLSRLLEAEQRMREAHLQAQVSRGILFDPFAEADAQAEMEAAEREKLPVMKPMKPSAGPAPSGFALQAAPASGGQLGGLASSAQLALPAPASSSSLFGGPSQPS